MRVCTGLDELILNVNDSRIFRCGRCVEEGCPRMEYFGNLASADEVYGICLLHYLEKTADHADAGYRPPRPVAVAHLRSRPAAAAALWSHKKMGNTFWQRQSGCGKRGNEVTKR